MSENENSSADKGEVSQEVGLKPSPEGKRARYYLVIFSFSFFSLGV